VFFLVVLILTAPKNAISQCFLSYIDGDMIVETSTGNKKLDNILHSQENDLELFFGLNVNLLFGTELNYQGNAFFSPNCNSLNCTGRIVMGKWLMNECKNKSDSYVRIISIMTHEFAHAMQHKYGWSGNSKYRELHADYLSGYYIGNLKSVSESEVKSSIQEFYSQGDFLFNDPGHHGTPEERGCAFLQGFKYAQGTNNVYSAYNSGKQYVIANNPCYRYNTVARPGYYFPILSGAQYDETVFVIATAAAIVLFSNDIYYRRIYSFQNPNPEDKVNYLNGNGWHVGLRRQFNRSALEYGVSNTGFKTKNEVNSNVFENTFFNMNYVHDITFSKLPERVIPYIGAGINLGEISGICGITGCYIPLFDRFKLDFRYELGNRVNQFQFGVIFKYQKEYLWNK